jgi:hypothetical protein
MTEKILVRLPAEEMNFLFYAKSRMALRHTQSPTVGKINSFLEGQAT